MHWCIGSPARALGARLCLRERDGNRARRTLVPRGLHVALVSGSFCIHLSCCMTRKKSCREWLMSADEAQTFLEKAQATLEYQRWQTQIWVDDSSEWLASFKVRRIGPARAKQRNVVRL